MPAYLNAALVFGGLRHCGLASLQPYDPAVKAPPPQLSAEFQGAVGDDGNAPKH